MPKFLSGHMGEIKFVGTDETSGGMTDSIAQGPVFQSTISLTSTLSSELIKCFKTL